MALIKCDECGGQMSDRALRCPHCGAPARMSSRAIVAVLLGVTAAVLGGLLAVSSVRSEAGAEPARAAAPMIVAALVVGVAVVMVIVAWVRSTRR